MVWFLLSVLFAPIVETLLLAFFLWLAGRVVHSVNALAILGGLVAAMGHSLVWLPWAFIIFWPFYVMSRTLLAWRPSGMAYALGVTTGIHVTYNLIPGIIALVFTGGGSGN
ncbi:MAG TPA: hypothetical protein PLA90_14985 [Candidatus Sumerlaeota bacterium]|nr:hypothetical protein [Candidatus Sumerlaeota bacterium]